MEFESPSIPNHLEKWFLNRSQDDFPNSIDYVANYRSIVSALKPIHDSVNAGADFTDKTTLTRHDSSHINRVITQITKLLNYEKASITAYEAFHLLVAVQIHDIKNIDGRDGHENRAIEIFGELGINGLIDTRLLKSIATIASCHAGSFDKDGKRDKDKITHLLSPYEYKGSYEIHPQYLAALLRLADEYADEEGRALSYLLSAGKIAKESIIHQKHAESLKEVAIKSDSGIIEYDYYILRDDAIKTFPKLIEKPDKFEEIYLLDEIFKRTVKSHFETVYCVRYLRPSIPIVKLSVTIEVEKKEITDKPFKLEYELIEKGYPNDNLTIFELCGDKLRRNGDFWTGENLMHYLTSK